MGGSSSLEIRQDFENLREECLSQGVLFEDKTFPPGVESIGRALLSEEQLRNLTWKRPVDLHRHPQLYVKGASRFDIKQGSVGDCWFLAALGSLTCHDHHLEWILPKNQGFSKDYAGIFHFRFWHFGQWADVVIDDRLPMNGERYLFVSPRQSNEFWPALLEKAYAKLCGSYQHIDGGNIADALVDFTGGIKKDIYLKKKPMEKVWEMMKRSDKLKCLMAAGIAGGTNRVLAKGLVEGHAYSVTGIAQVDYKGRTERLIRLWNPWGQEEWKGRWSDEAVQWERISKEEQDNLNKKKEDGEFWMALQDFRDYFNGLVISDANPEFMFSDNRQKWMVRTYENGWVAGVSAGGNHTMATFLKNPQYKLQLKKPDPESNRKQYYNVTVSLIQKPNRQGSGPHGISIVLHKDQNEDPFQGYLSHPLNQPKYTLEREISCKFILEPGTYVLIPCTNKAEQEAGFILRVFYRKQD
ncbi:calpain-14-like [Latimeria chalumnae]|uniref:calpain-14-like n=1 Tax=Latimeria chalumnae TaxID=7897 RepID=UPI0003C15066|nr:PREDICTED: calpain-14-like [Latimeria chalumnae]XP_006002667.1 PREDICTED: calpain-14-like [Latimeria chalumnae]|eukprot:XP_006002666.1 PREDICTED: calpain-14-like [Latimeria chalumnae]